ncbi:MAG: hypothetical protein IH624_00785 [Phycisphaerae bacterium]|nr:hypothetical protein [Phycisphaerae bacterium]
MKHRVTPFVVGLAMLAAPMFARGEAAPKPAMRDFMGMCVHTVQFKPELYKDVCRLVRDYHGLTWDVGKETDFWPTFPFARNRVNWETMYRSWTDAGYAISASIMFSGLGAGDWVDPARDANTYGFALARFFGPGNRNLIEAVEIGNEPGDYPDAAYRTIFENMARGIRAGDPQVKVATCAMTVGESEKYAKSVDCVKGLEDLYDVINFHSYAEVQGWPTWRRSFPEDPGIDFLKKARAIIDWRNGNAPGKQIWITEFGWDATTKPAPKEGTFKDWVGSTELEQARYLVRAYLVFSAMDLDRAYMYWFNDEDTPHVHGSSGLTRNYQPKPSYYAVSHLYKTLGDYHFSRVVTEKPGDLYVYEYAKRTDPKEKVQVVWSPTGSGRAVKKTLMTGANPYRAERMPLTAQGPESVPVVSDEAGMVSLTCDESPVYLWLRTE